MEVSRIYVNTFIIFFVFSRVGSLFLAEIQNVDLLIVISVHTLRKEIINSTPL